MIERGRLILTMMPSLYCKLDCPHCYLTKEQRKSKECLSLEQITITCDKIKSYYQSKGTDNATIDIYWYGGEPTSMGTELFSNMCDIINTTFQKHTVKHTLLSALVGVDTDQWAPIIKKYCNSKIQTSYDGLMRGERYDQTWQKQVRYAISEGLEVNTLSVFNQAIKKDGYEKTFIKLGELGIKECGWLPFQKNTRNNNTGMYGQYSTSMEEFSEFMISFTDMNDQVHRSAKFLIANEFFINSMIVYGTKMSNTGAQTLFLMPNGDMVLPDYDKDNIEFMKVFGNILTQSFEQVLTSQPRRDWLRKQINRNNNKECLACDRWNCCLMEFWKNNNDDDDCYGAKDYIEWLQSYNCGRDCVPEGSSVESMLHARIENIS